MITLGRFLQIGLGLLLVVFPWSDARGQLRPDQVLVLYNSLGPDADGDGVSDSQEVFEYYSQRRVGVLGMDFRDPTLWPGDISYSDFSRKLRDPLRGFLADQQIESQVAVFVLTRGMPHRILDMDNPLVGDDPSEATVEYDASDVTYASVDAELTLLWQSLEQGEQGAKFDSPADQVIFNPYHNQQQSITAYDRQQVTEQRAFEDFRRMSALWRMHDESQSGPLSSAGAIYLTSRLDGNSVADVQRMIDRARLPSYSSPADAIILDESPPGELDGMGLFEQSQIGHLGDDFENTFRQLEPIYQRMLFNQDELFLVGEGPGYTGTAPAVRVSGSVAALVSYGGNHDRGTGSRTNFGFVESLEGQLVDGAVMNTVESYNGRQFGGLPGFGDQGQLSQFIAVGGTFGIGNVWEPFAFSLADNEVLLPTLLDGELTWVEAAWSSIPWLSWQHVVVGDPLARITLISDPRLAVWNLASSPGPEPAAWEDGQNWIRGGEPDREPLPGDHVTFPQTDGVVLVDVGGDRIVESLDFQGDYVLREGVLAVRSGGIHTADGATVVLQGELLNGRGLQKSGGGSLHVVGRAADVDVLDGGFAASGSVTSLQVMPGASLSSAGFVEVHGDLSVADGARMVLSEVDDLLVNGFLVHGSAELDGVIGVSPSVVGGVTERGGRELLGWVVARGGFEANIRALEVDGDVVELLEGVSHQTLHVADGVFLALHQGPQQLSIERVFASQGDADGDMDVDAVDLSALLIGWTGADGAGASLRGWTKGDFDFDGDVDAADLTAQLANWTGFLFPEPLPIVLGDASAARDSWPPLPATIAGAPAVSGAYGAQALVPEPAAWGLSLLALAALAAGGRSGRRGE